MALDCFGRPSRNCAMASKPVHLAPLDVQAQCPFRRLRRPSAWTLPGPGHSGRVASQVQLLSREMWRAMACLGQGVHSCTTRTLQAAVCELCLPPLRHLLDREEQGDRVVLKLDVGPSISRIIPTHHIMTSTTWEAFVMSKASM